ncbi:MAG TPA: hypothetical protein VF992_09080 [Thermoplasmata archaeon]
MKGNFGPSPLSYPLRILLPGAVGATASERLTFQVYQDILCELHLLHKAGQQAVPSRVAYQVRLPNGRLMDRVAELVEMGLLGPDWAVTKRGYAYYDEYTRNVAPFLRKYGLGGKGRP